MIHYRKFLVFIFKLVTQRVTPRLSREIKNIDDSQASVCVGAFAHDRSLTSSFLTAQRECDYEAIIR